MLAHVEVGAPSAARHRTASFQFTREGRAIGIAQCFVPATPVAQSSHLRSDEHYTTNHVCALYYSLGPCSVISGNSHIQRKRRAKQRKESHMSSEVIPISHILSSDVAFKGDAYLVFEEEDVLDYSSNVPYFVFDVAVPEEKRERIQQRLREAVGEDRAAELVHLLDDRGWSTSFLYLG